MGFKTVLSEWQNLVGGKTAQLVEQFASGEAFCLQCRHEWVSVAPTGVVQLECPECHTLKGLFKFPFNFEVGALVRACNCGNQLFYLSPEGHLCANCGLYQGY